MSASGVPSRRVVGAALGAGLVLLFLRRPADLLRAGFWVEDLEIFFLQQHFQGFTPLRDYAGSLYLLQRLVALLLSPVPTAWAPTAYNACALLLNLLAPAVLLQTRAQAIIPSAPARFFAFFLLVLTPIASEVHGTVTNAHWPLAISLGVVLLLPPPRTRPGRVLELLAVALIGLSGFTALLVLPCAVVGVVRRASPYVVLRAAVTLATFSIQLAILVATADWWRGTLAEMARHPLVTAEVVTLRWGTARVLADAVTGDYVHWWPTLAPSLAIGLVVLGAVAWLAAGRLPAEQMALLASAAVGVASGMTARGAKPELLLYPPPDERYFYGAVAILGIVAAGALVAPLRSRAALVLAACCLVGAVVGFRLKPKPPRNWPRFAACFDARRGPCTTRNNPNRVVTVQLDGSYSVQYLRLPPAWEWWPFRYAAKQQAQRVR